MKNSINETKAVKIEVGCSDEFVETMKLFSIKGTVTHYIVRFGRIFGFQSYQQAEEWLAQFDFSFTEDEIKVMPSDQHSLSLICQAEIESRLNSILEGKSQKVYVEYHDLENVFLFSNLLDAPPSEGCLICFEASEEFFQSGIIPLSEEQRDNAIESEEEYEFLIASVTLKVNLDHGISTYKVIIVEIDNDKNENTPFSLN